MNIWPMRELDASWSVGGLADWACWIAGWLGSLFWLADWRTGGLAGEEEQAGWVQKIMVLD